MQRRIWKHWKPSASAEVSESSPAISSRAKTWRKSSTPADWLPPGSNRQPWEFIVVTDKEMIDQLTVVGKWMRKAGAIIAVVLDPYSRWWLEDGSAAIENMLIASTALGYGSCWVEGDALPLEEEFKTILSIPKGKRLLALVPVGVPAEWPTIEKRPLESVLHWQVY